MRHSHAARVTALLLVLCLTALFSALPILHAGHDCEGDGCAVCIVINRCQGQSASPSPDAISYRPIFAAQPVFADARTDGLRTPKTLTDLKIQLND